MKDNNLKNVRPALTAGQYYPAAPALLEERIAGFLDSVAAVENPGAVRAIMAPHAGLDYSGRVAASAYKLLSGRKIKTAVIICNSHSSYFPGVAIDEHDGWETPLGTVAVDQELARKLAAASAAINFNDEPFVAPDQTLEIQLPFLQTVLADGFKIVPIFFGNQGDESYKELARALKENLSADDLVVISTDMSHYPAYEDANRIDRQTLEIIKAADTSALEKHIADTESRHIPAEQTLLCGIDGVKTGLELYKLAGWGEIKILSYANSGDIAIGDKESVVGYGAVAFYETTTNNEQQTTNSKQTAGTEDRFDNLLNMKQQKELLDIARKTVEAFVTTGKIPEFKVEDERLNLQEGAFVTLHKDGQLRGCIGQIMPGDQPLWQVVRDMAAAACAEDNRFQPVSKDELEKLTYEISVLSAPELIADWQKIELGKHGVIVRQGVHSGVFLPQVAAETGWSREEFLSQLCFQKAGLAPDCYRDKDTELRIFTAQVLGETHEKNEEIRK